MKLTAIIPFYNHGRYVEQCLSAILGQSRRPDECLVINDGSTDGSEALLESIQKKDPVVRIIHLEKNQGVHAALNRGVLEATGDWLAFCAADDYILPGFFEECERAIEAHPDIGLCCGDYTTFEDKEPICLDRTRVLPIEHPLYLTPNDTIELCRNMDFVIGSNVSLYRKDLVLRYGMYDASVKSLADIYLCYQMALRHPIVYIPTPFSAFRYVANSYGSSIRFNLRARGALFSAYVKRVWECEDRAFRKAFLRSRLMSSGGYFFLLMLALRPWYWHRMLALLPQVLRIKIRAKWRKKEGDFGPLQHRFFYAKHIKQLALHAAAYGDKIMGER